MDPGPSDAGERDGRLGLRPLTARSVVLSLLLGSHPPRLPVRVLVRGGALFGIGEGTVRVALSRMARAGDVLREGGTYMLNPRLESRQVDQDLHRRPPTDPWDGTWTVLIGPGLIGPGLIGPGLSGPVLSGPVLSGPGHDDQAPPPTGRLARLADRVWMRPDNLSGVQPPGPEWLTLSARPDRDPTELARQLWDLAGWAEGAEALVSSFDACGGPANRFVVAAAILRHLRTDPLLPPELLPDAWPGDRLRSAYDRFEAELATLLRDTDRS